MKFTLPSNFKMKKDEINDSGIPYFYNNSWISNRQFAIKKTLLKDPTKYMQVTEIDMPDLDFLNFYFTESVETVFHLTPWIYSDHDGIQRRRLASPATKKYLYVDEKYIKAFGVTELHQEKKGDPCLAYNKELVLMPMKAPDEDSWNC